jgi:WD40 repeat protein/tRNA A-37 threonylcarbamoyl transferase component Bud32
MPSHIGDYQLLGEIARGGMGVVFKARQQSLGRTVALKMILDSQLVSQQQVKRFRGEAEAAARLDHSGIVSVYEVGEIDGRHFFSMALVEGGSLQKLVARGPIAPQAAAEMVAQIAQAVEYAHQQGVVHRDLKPQNILLDKHGQPKVTDFGLARRLDATDGLTASGDVVGTPGYMAPEQALGRVHEVGPLSDVYALGAILYCLLTGRPPFQAATLAETLRQIAEQEPVSPRLLNAATPLDLETICLKALQKDVGRRYASAQALADDLQRFLRGESILARPISTWEKAWRFCRRKPAWAGLIGALAAIVIAGVALVIVVSQLHVASANAISQKAKLDALQAEAKAHDAELEAQRKIADAQKYFALLAQIRQNAVARQPGWTWINQRMLAEAAALDTPAIDEFDMRSQAAESVGAFDLREIATADTRFHVSAMACAPNGKWVAVAQLKDWTACAVQVRSLPEGKVLHKLRFPSASFYQLKAARQDGTSSLAVSDDSRWIAVGTRSGMIHLWDLEAKEIEPRSWQCDDDSGIDGLRFHPDGQRLLSCSNKGILRSWSLDNLTGTELAADMGSWSRLPLSPDRQVLAGYRGLYSCSDFTQVTELQQGARRAAFHPCGRLLAQAVGSTLHLVSVSTGKTFRTFVDPELGDAHESGVDSLAFHPRGDWLASCSSQRLKIWEVASGALVANLLIGPAEESRLAFTVDGRHLIVAAQRELTTYELNGLAAQSFVAHEPLPITAIDVAHDGRGLACLSEAVHPADRNDQAEVSTWNLDGGAEQQRFSLNLPPSSEAAVSPSIAFDRQGSLLAVTPSSGDLRVLAIGEGQSPPASVPLQRGGSVAFSADGQRLWGLSTDRVVWWQTSNLQQTGEFSEDVSERLFGSSRITAISPIGDDLLLATSDKHLHRLSRDRGTVISTISLHQSPSALAIAPDQTWCAVGMLNRELQLLSLPGAQELERNDVHSDSVTAVAISSDQQQLASADKRRQLLLWRRDEGRLQKFLSLMLPERSRTLRFSPSGDKLCLLLHNEQAVRVWDLESLREKTAELLKPQAPSVQQPSSAE